MYTVSYYVYDERCWQFCGEYSNIADARIAARAIRADRHGNQVRIMGTETGKRVPIGRRGAAHG